MRISDDVSRAGPSSVWILSARTEVVEELSKLLGKLGADPVPAPDPGRWSSAPPDLLFLDLAPGCPSVRDLRNRLGRACEIVCLVDNESFHRLLPSLAAGAGDYLFLPLNAGEVGLRWERHRSGRGGTRALHTDLHADLGLEFPSSVEYARAVISEVVEACERIAFAGPRARLNLKVALGEALANAILYGNRQDTEKRVRVQAELRPGEAVITVSDEGEGFDPDSVVDPTRPENRDRSHGRGLFLLRSLADEVRYNERGNAVTLVLRG